MSSKYFYLVVDYVFFLIELAKPVKIFIFLFSIYVLNSPFLLNSS